MLVVVLIIASLIPIFLLPPSQNSNLTMKWNLDNSGNNSHYNHHNHSHSHDNNYYANNSYSYDNHNVNDKGDMMYYYQILHGSILHSNDKSSIITNFYRIL